MALLYSCPERRFERRCGTSLWRDRARAADATVHVPRSLGPDTCVSRHIYSLNAEF